MSTESISNVLWEGCNNERDYLIRRDFYGAIDGLSEPSGHASVVLGLTDVCIELHNGDSLGSIYKQRFMGTDYSSFNGDTLSDYYP